MPIPLSKNLRGAEMLVDSDGRLVPITSLAATPHYTNGVMDYITYGPAADGSTWRQTFSYNTDGSWAGSSELVKQ